MLTTVINKSENFIISGQLRNDFTFDFKKPPILMGKIIKDFIDYVQIVFM